LSSNRAGATASDASLDRILGADLCIRRTVHRPAAIVVPAPNGFYSCYQDKSTVMPAYKYESESESDGAVQNEFADAASEVSDMGEAGPDDTFHFRQSFSKAPRYHIPREDLNETSFLSDDVDELEMEQSYDEEMQEEEFLDEDSMIFSDEFEEGPNATESIGGAFRIERRSNWLEQIDYTDRAVKRLKVMSKSESLQNAKIHWGGRTPEMKYTVEDLERDLFGESGKVQRCWLYVLISDEETKRFRLSTNRRFETWYIRPEKLGGKGIAKVETEPCISNSMGTG
jgi:hypothetical protein